MSGIFYRKYIKEFLDQLPDIVSSCTMDFSSVQSFICMSTYCPGYALMAYYRSKLLSYSDNDVVSI